MPQSHVAKAQTAVLWLRRDLRVADNPALVAALQAAVTVVRSLVATTTSVESPLHSPRMAEFATHPHMHPLLIELIVRPSAQDRLVAPSATQLTMRPCRGVEGVTRFRVFLSLQPRARRYRFSCGLLRRRVSFSRVAARDGGSCRVCGRSRRILWRSAANSRTCAARRVVQPSSISSAKSVHRCGSSRAGSRLAQPGFLLTTEHLCAVIATHRLA